MAQTRTKTRYPANTWWFRRAVARILTLFVLDELVKGVGRVLPLTMEVALTERVPNGVISVVVYVLVGRRFVNV